MKNNVIDFSNCESHRNRLDTRFRLAPGVDCVYVDMNGSALPGRKAVKCLMIQSGSMMQLPKPAA